MLKDFIAVGLGGMLGAMARYGLNVSFSLIGPTWLPIATLSANTIGCFAIGWLGRWSINAGTSSDWWVVGIRVGILGGLTTFSTFALEIVYLWLENRTWQSFALVVANIALGILAVLAGIYMANATGSAPNPEV